MKLRNTALAVTKSHRGTDGSTANFHTNFTAHMEAVTPKRTASGRASTATVSATPARNSRKLDEKEKTEWFRLWRIRKRGMMLTMNECDWLIEVVGRMGK